MELEHATDIAEQAAREAGRILEEWAVKFTAREKSRSNLVTEADFASQTAIHQILSQSFPEHGFLGEEGLQLPASGGEYRWIIDPLDGTGNYVHRFPYYCVSIALECRNELVAGVVFDPNRNEMFRAIKGSGATLNGTRVSVSDYETLSESMVVASLPVAVSGNDPAVMRFLKVMPVAQSLQRTGSAALNLCYVAAGRMEGYWSTNLKPWDMAAGVLLVEEAGGRVSRTDGSTF
ncbi:MAG TPA: inositol monophosphatase family protein, partial [Planctomycetaceae bacterium]|nr:inositol monophosphatase family protein [Planctomycetaceae bacterium]